MEIIDSGSKRPKLHKNIRGADYFAQSGEEKKESTPILRLREFVNWAKHQGLCRCEYDFEQRCSLSQKYIANNIHGGKGNLGTQILGRIIRVFPQLNLAWLCTGEGAMVLSDINTDYKQAYEGAMMQIEALNKILRNNAK